MPEATPTPPTPPPAPPPAQQAQAQVGVERAPGVRYAALGEGRRHDRDELEGMGLTIPPEWALDSDGQLLRDGNGLPVTKSGPFAGRVAVPGAKKNPPPEAEPPLRTPPTRRTARRR